MLKTTKEVLQDQKKDLMAEIGRIDQMIELVDTSNGEIRPARANGAAEPNKVPASFRREIKKVKRSSAARQRLRMIMVGKHILGHRKGMSNIPKGIATEDAIKAFKKYGGDKYDFSKPARR
jgi:hypothetical protein